MTIAAEKLVIERYVSDGVNTRYTFGFRVFSPSDVVVFVSTGTGTDRKLNYLGDYTVTVFETVGGFVTLRHPVDEGVSLAISRDIPVTQMLDLTNQGAFFAEDIERAFDKMTAIAQDAKDVAARSITVPSTSIDNGEALRDALLLGKAEAEKLLESQPAIDRLAESADNIDALVPHSEAVDIVAPHADAIGTNINELVAVGADLRSEYSHVLHALGNADRAEIAQADAVEKQSLASQAADEATQQAQIATSAAEETKRLEEAIRTIGTSEYLTQTIRLLESLTDRLQDGCFQLDVSGNLMPKTEPASNNEWDIDGNGDIMPKEI